MTYKRHAQTPLSSEPPQHLAAMALWNRALGQSDIGMGGRGGVDEDEVVEAAVNVQMILEKKCLSLIHPNK